MRFAITDFPRALAHCSDLERLRRATTQRPLVVVSLGVLVGHISATLPASWLFRIGGLVGALLWVCLCRARPGRLLGGFAFAAIALGNAQLDQLLRPVFPEHHVVHFAGTVVEVRGRIADRPMRDAAKTRFVVEVTATRRKDEWQAASGRVLVSVRNVTQPWLRDDRVIGLLRLRRPRNFGNPDEFDYEAYLARRRVYVTSFCNDDRLWHRDPAAKGSVARRLEEWRQNALQAIQNTLAPHVAAILAALLLGESAALGATIREPYALTGMSHVLAISGLHIGLVASAAYGITRWLLSRSEWLLLHGNVPKLAMALSVFPVLFYAAMAGGRISTVRAVAMVFLVVAAVLLDRQRDWLTALAAAALGASLWWPGSIFEISFQLSFGAVLAIVVGLSRLTNWWDSRERGWQSGERRPRPLLRWLLLYEATTICAMIGTAPLTAWHFNRLAPIGLLTNPALVPFLGLIPVSLGLLGVLVVPIAPELTTILLQLAGSVVQAADTVVRLAAAIPGATVRTVTPSLLELGLFYATITILLMPRGRARLALLFLCALILAGDLAYWHGQRFHRPNLQLTFFSVGQGDSILIEFPGSAVMVVDGGGVSTSFDVGERVVATQLWRHKIRHVDFLVLTHPDFDHFGGLDFLARTFSPAEFWWNGSPGDGRRFRAFWETLSTLPARVVGRGYRRTIGGVEITTLHPGPETRGSKNNRSLTLSLRYGPTTVLLPGDLEMEGEAALLRHDRDQLRSTILKVPHHGSRTSSSAAFLAAVEPRLAIFSAGHQNRFGFPHAAVLQAYQTHATTILRTDRDGAVTLDIEPSGDITVRTGRAG